MDPQFQQLFKLILDIKKDQDVIKEQTFKNTANLELHMKRTDQNEELIVMQNERITKLENQEQILSGLWKVSLSAAGLVGTILGIIVAIHQLR